MADTPSSPDALLLDAEGVRAYLREAWPSRADAQADAIREIEPGRVLLHVVAGPDDLRPGGSISGPTLMTWADTAAFVLCLAHLGDAAMAVTSHLSMEFLRRALGEDLLVEARMEKMGRTQLTFTVRIHTGAMGAERGCAIATVVYSRALLGS